MMLIYEFDLNILIMYLHTNNELSRSSISKLEHYRQTICCSVMVNSPIDPWELVVILLLLTASVFSTTFYRTYGTGLSVMIYNRPLASS